MKSGLGVLDGVPAFVRKSGNGRVSPEEKQGIDSQTVFSAFWPSPGPAGWTGAHYHFPRRLNLKLYVEFMCGFVPRFTAAFSRPGDHFGRNQSFIHTCFPIFHTEFITD